MNFDKVDLRQIDDRHIDSFEELNELAQLTKRLVEDLKAITDQNPFLSENDGNFQLDP